MLRCSAIVYFLITVTSALECGKVPIDNALESRVAGGHVPAEGNWPFVVNVLNYVVREGENLTVPVPCTGSIVGRRHVLTAAHCVDDLQNRGSIKPSGIKVRMGSVSRKDQISLNVSNFFMGPQWYRMGYGTGWADDVAILELEEPIEFGDYAQPICLPKSFRERPGDPGYLVGWGEQNIVPEPHNHTTDYEGEPLVANENIVTFRKWTHCNPYDYGPFRHREDVVCVGQYMRLATAGDSGGPLMVNRKGVWFQVGADSLGMAQDGRRWGIFARVTSYCKWFKNVTNGAVACV